MPDRNLPTDQERAKVERIASWRRRLLLVPIIPLAVIGLSRLVPEEHEWLMLGLAITAVAVLLIVLGYASFGLRCPRCASWVGVAVSKCASCGLKLEAPKRASAPAVSG